MTFCGGYVGVMGVVLWVGYRGGTLGVGVGWWGGGGEGTWGVRGGGGTRGVFVWEGYNGWGTGVCRGLWGYVGGGSWMMKRGRPANFFALLSKNQKPVACNRNRKELRREKGRPKNEQKSNKI